MREGEEFGAGRALGQTAGAVCSNVGHESMKGKYYYPIKGHTEVGDRGDSRRDSITVMKWKKRVNKIDYKTKNLLDPTL